MKKTKSQGFSLLEILLALGIMAAAVTGILGLFGSGQAMGRRAETVSVATMLARQKMAEVTLDLEKQMREGKLPQDTEHAEGAFDPPFERFRWAKEIRKVELPIPRIQEGKVDLMQAFLQTISKQIAEAVREVKLTISWTARETERTLVVTTHVVNL